MDVDVRARAGYCSSFLINYFRQKAVLCLWTNKSFIHQNAKSGGYCRDIDCTFSFILLLQESLRSYCTAKRTYTCTKGYSTAKQEAAREPRPHSRTLIHQPSLKEPARSRDPPTPYRPSNTYLPCGVCPGRQ